MTRRFWKQTYTITVLRDNDAEPGDYDSLEALAYDIDEGESVGQVDLLSTEELTGKQMADALYALGSEPGFFMLDDEDDEASDG